MNHATSQAGAGAAGPQVTELRLPDFIVIGAMRSGTTSLANFLNRQPRLRDPAQRAQSHYWHRVARDIEHLPLVDALRAEEARMADPATTHPGMSRMSTGPGTASSCSGTERCSHPIVSAS